MHLLVEAGPAQVEVARLAPPRLAVLGLHSLLAYVAPVTRYVRRVQPAAGQPEEAGTKKGGANSTSRGSTKSRAIVNNKLRLLLSSSTFVIYNL